MPFLYHTLDIAAPFAPIDNSRFVQIEDNLNPKFPIREYQVKSFSRFDYFLNNDFFEKQRMPYHLLYNMATGSGKTLVMAGLMLYLYEKGYRNFLFFVKSNNIIVKTKDNFLNTQSSKYLFNNRIGINENEIIVKEVSSFDEADNKNINIKFTTIQQLHYDINNSKENSITLEDFENKKIVLLADEAHNFNAGIRQGDLFGTWEETVEKILNANLNKENILLEFTATLDYNIPQIVDKYIDKVIYKYDLAQFRVDKYSKEINLVRSQFGYNERIIQALILNLYRQELAALHNINLKPVILFKAKSTITESEQNKLNFHSLIERMSADSIEKIRNESTVSIIQKAFNFFERLNIMPYSISDRIKSNFKPENCISANNDSEAELNQIRLNSLEDENNPIRAVFAVQKLNEGWDVLNLFDIVRLYETRDGRNGNPGPTTLSEAQLIGRGARYFPFKLNNEQDKYKRKYDDDIGNDLKVLEELYYHTLEDNRYISELKSALVQSGAYEDDEDLITKQLILKEEFKQTNFYQTAQVVYNKRIVRSYDNIRSFSDLGVVKRNFAHKLSSGFGKLTSAFFEMEINYETETEIGKDIKLSEISAHIIRFALTKNPFYHFNNLQKFFPALRSINQFIADDSYLGGLELTYIGANKRIDNTGITHLKFCS